jgi:hypothetical protein
MYQGESSSSSESKSMGSTATCPPVTQPGQSREGDISGVSASGRQPGSGTATGGTGTSGTQQLSSKASEFVERTREGLHTVADRARQEAGAVWHRMRDQSENVLSQGKERTAEGVGHFASAIKQTADRLHEEGDHNIAGYAEDVSCHLDRAAQYLRENDLRSLVNDLGNTVRRRPGLFFAGLFIGGLVAARFMKASRMARQREEQAQGRRESWTGSQWENEGGAVSRGELGSSTQGQVSPSAGYRGSSSLPGLPDDAARMSGQPGLAPTGTPNSPDTGFAPESGEPTTQPGYRPQPGF